MSIKKKRKEKTNVTIRVNLLNAQIIMGVIALIDLMEEVGRQVSSKCIGGICMDGTSRINRPTKDSINHIPPSPSFNPASAIPDLTFKVQYRSIYFTILIYFS